jgi:hypothetical protein
VTFLIIYHINQKWQIAKKEDGKFNIEKYDNAFVHQEFNDINDVYEKRRQKEMRTLNIANENPIYCLMVTGKDSQRIRYAVQSVRNFINQKYYNKHLIIVNHHPSLNVIDAYLYEEQITRLELEDILNRGLKDGEHKRYIYEVYIEKTANVSLGDLRNFSLQLVPMGAFWTIWDDDDWRSFDYLKVLNYTLNMNNVDAVVLTRRYEYNMNKKFSWMMELKTGFPLILCRQNPLIKYNNVDTMEDIHLIQSIKDIGYKVYIFENDPKLYIRIVHDNNTSLYAKQQKSEVTYNIENRKYNEFEVDSSEKIYISMNVNDLVSTKTK